MEVKTVFCLIDDTPRSSDHYFMIHCKDWVLSFAKRIGIQSTKTNHLKTCVRTVQYAHARNHIHCFILPSSYTELQNIVKIIVIPKYVLDQNSKHLFCT